MSKKTPTGSTNGSHPPPGTLIDNHSLELVEVLGVGGYGVVYRAIDAYSNKPRSYAVKCLPSLHGQSSARRQMHLREITMHQLASAHPNVVTIHRVVEEYDHTFIVMDYATDQDLFTQILHKCRYLGDDRLIKHIFMQLLDAVQYCHRLSIYHRDLKPENVLCFESGFRVAVTDFGLATTDKLSEEFRTGSIYHMSPECQAAEPHTTSPYSPMHNDIWSLGIILLNLATGRNPWKSATPDDPTFQSYKRDPHRFLPSVLPISEEFNDILVRLLAVEWKKRMSLMELRNAMERLETFYSDNVVFEGNLARCPWEVGMDLGNGTNHKPFVRKRPVPEIPKGIEPYRVASTSTTETPVESQGTVTDDLVSWGDKNPLYDDRQIMLDSFLPDEPPTIYEVSGRSSFSSDNDSPTTPTSAEGHGHLHNFGHIEFPLEKELQNSTYYDKETGLYLNTNMDNDEDCFASSTYLATPVKEVPQYAQKPPKRSHNRAFRTEKRYSSPNTSIYSVAEASIYSRYSSGSHNPDSSPAQDNRTSKRESHTSDRAWAQYKVPRSEVEIAGREDEHITKTAGQSAFNPKRLIPRATGNWLNPRTSAARDQHGTHQTHGLNGWDDHQQLSRPAQSHKLRKPSRNQRESRGESRANQEWISGKLLNAAR